MECVYACVKMRYVCVNCQITWSERPIDEARLLQVSQTGYEEKIKNKTE